MQFTFGALLSEVTIVQSILECYLVYLCQICLKSKAKIFLGGGHTITFNLDLEYRCRPY